MTDIDHMDRRVRVDKADQLRAYYAKHSHGTVAVVDKPSSDDEGFPVAVLRCQAAGNRQVGSKGRMKKKVVSLASGPSAGRQQQAPHTGCAGTTSEPGTADHPASGLQITSQLGSSCRHRPWQVSPFCG